MSVLKFCHLKKNDRVIVSSGDYKGHVGIVTGVLRDKERLNRFLVSVDTIPKRKVKKKKGGELSERDFLIDASNISVLENEDSVLG